MITFNDCHVWIVGLARYLITPLAILLSSTDTPGHHMKAKAKV